MDDVTRSFLLAGILVWLLPVGTGVLAGVIAVGLVGPRVPDSLIVPGMAASAAAFVVMLELEDYAPMAAVSATVAGFTAVAQRWALSRFGPASSRQRGLGAALTVVAGVLVGAFFGYVAGRQNHLELIPIGASIGGAFGAAAAVRQGRSEDDSAGGPTRPSHILENVFSRHPGLIVALDGPGSSGKSSVGAAAALKLGFRFCDTGLLYRAATWLALERGVAAGDAAALVALVPEIALVADANGRLAHVSVDGRDVTEAVHTPRVDEAVSAVSGVAELRSALLEWQRSLAAEPGGIIMAGRDIGTVVLPDADLKIFLDASVEERARRRIEEREVDPASEEARFILAQLRRRDELDSTRAVAPLRPADDAFHIVTDGNEFSETVAAVVAEIRAAAERAGLTATGGRR